MQIDNTALNAALAHAASELTHTAPLMQRLSVALLSVTEDNFQSEGRPAWAGLSPVTLARRRAGSTRILQDSGQLAASVTPWHNDTTAAIGSNKIYARIQQFGAAKHSLGPKSPWGNIPARPFLPITGSGALQPEAEDECLDTISNYLAHVLGNP